MGVITIGANDFIRGISTSNDLPDGGFSASSKGQNLLANVGTLNTEPTLTTKITNFDASEPIVAQLSSGTSTIIDLMVTTGGDLYTLAFGANPTKTASSGLTLTAGVVDMKEYENNIYITTDEDVMLAPIVFTSVDEDWWTTAKGESDLQNSTVHPMLIFDKKLWIADGAELHYWDDTNVSTDNLPLLATEQISALGIEPSTGNMLIAVDSDANTTDTKTKTQKILIWDGFSAVRNREIEVQERITTFFNSSSGVVYVVMGRMFGYFNGNGITVLKQLDINFSTSGLINNQKITEINGTIYIAEGNNVLAYGKLYPKGNMTFYYPLAIGSEIGTINRFYNDTSGHDSYASLSWATGSVIKLSYFDVKDDSGGNASRTWKSNVTYLPSNSRITKVEVLTEPLTSGDTLNFELLKTSTDGTTGVGSMDFSTDGAISQKTFGREKNIETSAVQVAINQSAGSARIKQIKVYYDPLEKEV
jgi:hypothetical protein